MPRIGTAAARKLAHIPWDHSTNQLRQMGRLTEGGQAQRSDWYYAQSYGRLHRKGLARTITGAFPNAGSGRNWHPTQNRSLTLREGCPSRKLHPRASRRVTLPASTSTGASRRLRSDSNSANTSDGYHLRAGARRDGADLGRAQLNRGHRVSTPRVHTRGAAHRAPASPQLGHAPAARSRAAPVRYRPAIDGRVIGGVLVQRVRDAPNQPPLTDRRREIGVPPENSILELRDA